MSKKKMFVRVLSIAMVLVLSFGVFSASAAVVKGTPKAESWVVWSEDLAKFEDTDNGTAISFLKGVAQNDRVGFKHAVDLDGFTFTISDYTSTKGGEGQDNRLVFSLGNNLDESWTDKNSITLIFMHENNVLRVEGTGSTGFDLTTETPLETKDKTTFTLSFSKRSDGDWDITINGTTGKIPAAVVENAIDDVTKVGFAVGGAWYSFDEATSFVISEMGASNGAEFVDESTTPTPEETNKPGDTTAKPSTPATGDQSAVKVAVFAAALVLAACSLFVLRQKVK